MLEPKENVVLGTEIKVPHEKTPENYTVLFKRGLKLFSLNLETDILSEVEIKETEIDLGAVERRKNNVIAPDKDDYNSIKHRVLNDGKSIMFQALNMKNARRKAKKFLNDYYGKKSLQK